MFQGGSELNVFSFMRFLDQGFVEGKEKMKCRSLLFSLMSLSYDPNKTLGDEVLNITRGSLRELSNNGIRDLLDLYQEHNI